MVSSALMPSPQSLGLLQKARFGQRPTAVEQTALERDLKRLGDNVGQVVTREVQQPGSRSKNILGFLLEWFAWGTVFDLGEHFAHLLINIFKAVFENLGDILGGIFN